MEKYIAVLGRQPLISAAELECLYSDVTLLTPVHQPKPYHDRSANCSNHCFADCPTHQSGDHAVNCSNRQPDHYSKHQADHRATNHHPDHYSNHQSDHCSAARHSDHHTGNHSSNHRFGRHSSGRQFRHQHHFLEPTPVLAEFAADQPDISRLGGTIKIGREIELPTFLRECRQLPTGKITLGLSDFSTNATAATAQREANKLKIWLTKRGRSVRIVPNQSAVLSSAVSLHNSLFKERKIEIVKCNNRYFRIIQLSNLEDYVKRDRKRPARDARVGMLPPKLAQILINLCGPLAPGTRLLDPFCGTGVVLQEATLMGLAAYGTDISPRMVEYSEKNLAWLGKEPPRLELGDATTHTWHDPIGAVACEGYLGPPLSQPPANIKLREIKQECRRIILGFLRNLAPQIASGTPVVMAIPAWLRPDGSYEHLGVLDEIEKLRYNVYSFRNLGQNDLLYRRRGQVVAREIIVLRKK